MSDRMNPIPFKKLLAQIITEYNEQHTVFGVRKKYISLNSSMPKLNIFGETCEMPFGPAAGPNTQLAQNIAAAYFAGSRFFELKTVQKIDGEDLPVSKPCILAEDEGYNVEWSTELTVPAAFDEYVKAWWLCRLMAVELGLGSPDGFIFNMSVGYDLEGIQTPKIDSFIEGLKDAGSIAAPSQIWEECRLAALEGVDTGLLKKVTAKDIDNVPSHICRSVTLSTLHGCPAGDIEKIASYLLTEKGLNTFIKLNPTLLGYDYARKTLDDMGYSYVSFGRFHFEDDLQYDQAVPMLKRLQQLAASKELEFGVKITNTFPVDIKRGELPGSEMYMSGRALYPLSLSVAEKLSKDFEGSLRISFSGGADAFNIVNLYKTGIRPITFATTILKPGGYNRIAQIAQLFDAEYSAASSDTLCGSDSSDRGCKYTDTAAIVRLTESAKTDPHHIKPVKTAATRKSKKSLPLFDCFMSPCSDACPIGQDITAYMYLVNEGRFLDALKVITYKNPLPNITGTICAHPCMGSCTRRFCDLSVDIRSKKKKAALEASVELEKYLGEKKLHSITANRIKVAVIGAGPAGIASAFLLARAGFEPVVYDKRESGGGTVAHVITEQRIPRAAIAQDISFAAALGAKFIYGREIKSLEELKNEGFRYVIVCTGAGIPGKIRLSGTESDQNGKVSNGCGVIGAIDFLERVVKHDPALVPGRNVVVIGAGNTAMDAARAAIQLQNDLNIADGSVKIVYRRDKRNMPADVEELELALRDGVEFKELLSPFAYTDDKLFCKKNILGEPDASGRQIPMETEEIVSIPADTVITAVGEKVDSLLYEALEIECDEKGCPVTDTHNQSCVDSVYIAGDGRKGPATIVEAIHDAAVAVDDIIRRSGVKTDGNPIIDEARSLITLAHQAVDLGALRAKKGTLDANIKELCADKCLGCDKVCENCVDVCPNRANVSIAVPGMDVPQIIHIDDMCNECGNCASFCPYSGRPYKDKLTLFSDLKSFTESENQGFILIDKENLTFRVRYDGSVTDEEPFSDFCSLHEPLLDVIRTLHSNYPYFF